MFDYDWFPLLKVCIAIPSTMKASPRRRGLSGLIQLGLPSPVSERRVSSEIRTYLQPVGGNQGQCQKPTLFWKPLGLPCPRGCLSCLALGILSDMALWVSVVSPNGITSFKLSMSTHTFICVIWNCRVGYDFFHYPRGHFPLLSPRLLC